MGLYFISKSTARQEFSGLPKKRLKQTLIQLVVIKNDLLVSNLVPFGFLALIGPLVCQFIDSVV